MIFWNVRLLHYQELKYRKIPVLRYVNFNTTLAKKKVGIPLKVIEKRNSNIFFSVDAPERILRYSYPA